MIPKFRAWDKTHKKIGLIDADMQDGLFQSVKIFDEDEDDWQESDRFVLMQSTGLFDKNGTEIFEGDILAVETDDEVINVNVFWDKKHALFMFESKKYNEEELLAELVEDNIYPFEIVGNIWDGGDLIDN